MPSLKKFVILVAKHQDSRNNGRIKQALTHVNNHLFFKRNPFVLNLEDGMETGILAFEIEWAHVVGIDYKCPLHDDGRLVLEASCMLKRSFKTVEAVRQYYEWMPGQSVSIKGMEALQALEQELNGPAQDDNIAQHCDSLTSGRASTVQLRHSLDGEHQPAVEALRNWLAKAKLAGKAQRYPTPSKDASIQESTHKATSGKGSSNQPARSPVNLSPLRPTAEHNAGSIRHSFSPETAKAACPSKLVPLSAPSHRSPSQAVSTNHTAHHQPHKKYSDSAPKQTASVQRSEVLPTTSLWSCLNLPRSSTASQSGTAYECPHSCQCSNSSARVYDGQHLAVSTHPHHQLRAFSDTSRVEEQASTTPASCYVNPSIHGIKDSGQSSRLDAEVEVSRASLRPVPTSKREWADTTKANHGAPQATGSDGHSAFSGYEPEDGLPELISGLVSPDQMPRHASFACCASASAQIQSPTKDWPSLQHGTSHLTACTGNHKANQQILRTLNRRPALARSADGLVMCSQDVVPPFEKAMQQQQEDSGQQSAGQGQHQSTAWELASPSRLGSGSLTQATIKQALEGPSLHRRARSAQNLQELADEQRSNSRSRNIPGPARWTSASACYRSRTVILTFRDPMLPGALRQFVKSEMRLLKLYESGLPAWAVFLPSYGLWYRPWMRWVTWLLFICISIFSMACGFYDLYKNVPYLKEVVARITDRLYIPTSAFFEWLEQHTQVRLSILLTYLFSKSPLFLALMKLIRSFMQLVSQLLQPVASLLLQLLQPVADAGMQLLLPFAAATSSIGSAVWTAAYTVTCSLFQPFLSAAGVLTTWLGQLINLVAAPPARMLWQMLMLLAQALMSVAGVIKILLSGPLYCATALGGLLQGCAATLWGNWQWLLAVLSSMGRVVSSSVKAAREAAPAVQATQAAVSVAMQQGGSSSAMLGRMSLEMMHAFDLVRHTLVRVVKAAQAVANFFVTLCLTVNQHRVSLLLQLRHFLQRKLPAAVAEQIPARMPLAHAQSMTYDLDAHHSLDRANSLPNMEDMSFDGGGLDLQTNGNCHVLADNVSGSRQRHLWTRHTSSYNGSEAAWLSDCGEHGLTDASHTRIFADGWHQDLHLHGHGAVTLPKYGSVDGSIVGTLHRRKGRRNGAATTRSQ